MLLCHKLAASNEAEVLQACDICQTVRRALCMQSCKYRQCISCQRRERLCAGEHLIQSNVSLLVSQTPSLGSDASPPPPLHEAVVVPKKTACMQSK